MQYHYPGDPGDTARMPPALRQLLSASGMIPDLQPRERQGGPKRKVCPDAAHKAIILTQIAQSMACLDGDQADRARRLAMDRLNELLEEPDFWVDQHG